MVFSLQGVQLIPAAACPLWSYRENMQRTLLRSTLEEGHDGLNSVQNSLSNPWQSPPLHVRILMVFQMIPEMVAGQQGNDVREITGPGMMFVGIAPLRLSVWQIGTEVE